MPLKDLRELMEAPLDDDVQCLDLDERVKTTVGDRCLELGTGLRQPTNEARAEPNLFELCLARRRNTTVKHPQTTQGQRSLTPSTGRLRVSERRAVLARAIPSGSSLDEVNGSRE